MNPPAALPGSVSAPAWRLSPQRVDPLGVLGVRSLSMVGGIGAFVYGLIATIVQWPQVTNGALAVYALLALAAACGYFLRSAHPDHAPFTWQAGAIVLAFALLASLLESFSRYGQNQFIQDDFGQVAVAVLLLSMAPYRSGLTLIIGAVIASVVLALQTAVDVRYLAIQAPFAEYVVVVVVPPLALGIAAASFSIGLVSGVHAWQREAARAALAHDASALEGVARSVQQEQVTVLSREALPFLLHILSTKRIEATEPEQARAIAQHLRGSLVAEIGRTWLDEVADLVEAMGGGTVTVEDQTLLALGMNGEQRAACAALIEAVGGNDVLGASAMRIAVTEVAGSGARVEITASVRAGLHGRQLRQALSQYLAVVRVVFRRVRLNRSGDKLTLGFEYAQQ